ncbi:MAG: HAMP domain-containing sensor histidine kinase [Patescibacteria group bacterium]|nr:HAMP domain-containing sensor histidine kinase [Patescibacteria group bacterium]
MTFELLGSVSKFFSILKNSVLPKSKESDSARKEFILNILLVAILAVILTSLAIHITFWNMLHSIDSAAYDNNTLSLGVLLGLLAFFSLLYFLSRKGFFSLASYLLLASLFLFASYMGYRWGTELPPVLLFLVLIIVMSGVLISTRFAFLMTTMSALAIFTMGYAQINNLTHPNLYWKAGTIRTTDIIMFVVIFLVIAIVSWLSNREIEKSLARARGSEAELKKERDSLEVIVEERTKELKEAQFEQMAQLYRFAEFGRLSSGLFHDLINPLNAVALNMEKVKCQDEHGVTLNETRMYLDKALKATKKMENFVLAVRKQMTRQGDNIVFSLTDEVKQVIDVLSYKALKANTELNFYSSGNIETFGDAIKFSQVALNLIANAIDANGPPDQRTVMTSDKIIEEYNRKVDVFLTEEDSLISLIVRDYGKGIPKEYLDKIFDQFFTTKGSRGLGIGLCMVKRIIEKDFHGTIRVESEENKGTTFTIKFLKINNYG